MSYTELIIFKDGKPSDGIEFRNAWGGAARIWDALFKAHVPKKSEYDSWLSGASDDRRLWDIASRDDVPIEERAVHAFTFDLFYVAKKNFGRFTNDLRGFVEKYPASPGHIDHLPAFAKWFDENSDVEAVGLYGTSVSENPWYRHQDDDEDEPAPVPLSEGREVYAWLEDES